MRKVSIQLVLFSCKCEILYAEYKIWKIKIWIWEIEKVSLFLQMPSLHFCKREDCQFCTFSTFKLSSKSSSFSSSILSLPFLDIGIQICLIFYLFWQFIGFGWFLSDPGIPGVRSMGPSLSNKLTNKQTFVQVIQV